MNEPKNPGLAARIQQRLDALGLSASEASRAATNKPDLIRRIMTGKAKTGTADAMTNLAQVLLTTVEWLETGAGPEIVAPRPAARTEIRPAAITPPSREAMPRDVPVFGTAAGALLSPGRMVEPKEGAFVISDDTVDYVRRPPALESVRDAYALYIEGESMVPAFRPGDLVFVNPHRKVRPADMVILQCRFVPQDEGGEVEAYVKQLVRRTADKTHVQQFNKPGQIVFDNQYIVAVHRVMTMADLFGI